jgi:hypothetical protein
MRTDAPEGRYCQVPLRLARWPRYLKLPAAIGRHPHHQGHTGAGREAEHHAKPSFRAARLSWPKFPRQRAVGCCLNCAWCASLATVAAWSAAAIRRCAIGRRKWQGQPIGLSRAGALNVLTPMRCEFDSRHCRRSVRRLQHVVPPRPIDAPRARSPCPAPCWWRTSRRRARGYPAACR